MARTRAYLVALACLGWAGFAHALGLGEIEIRSRLNQPISAVIPISAGAGETDDLVVTLASNEEFDRAGMERAEFLSSLRFEVQGDTIKVTSKQIAREPFVSFLLDVRWSGGRLLREYTVLLDPPTLAQSAPTRPAPAAAAQPAPPPAAMESTPPPAMASGPESSTPETSSTAPSAPADGAPAPSAPATTAGQTYGPVSPKETLWSIAYKLRPDPATITMDQMQVAIFNANPQAFHQGKLTGLMKGAMLRIPGSDEIRAVDAATAKQQVAEARAAGGGAPAPSYQAAAPTAAPAPEAAPTPAPEPAPEPQVESKPEPVVEAPAPTPPAEVAQAPAETPPPAEAPPPAETAPAPAPEPAPAPAEEPQTTPSPQPAAAPAAPEEPGMLAEVLERGRGLMDSPFAIPALAGIVVLLVLVFAGRKLADKVAKWRYERAARKEQVAPVAAAAAGSEDVTQVAEEPPSLRSALDEAAGGTDATMTMGAAAPVAATQAMGEQTLQQTMQQTLQQPASQTQALEPALASSGKVDFDVTGAFASETVQINLDAGDPVSEAEFHRAYGLYDEAALLLKQALQKDPKRTDARVKLAEIYFEANKANEFVEVAKELKSQLPDAEWQKIALLGSQIAPGNELFAGGGGVSVAGGVDLSFDEPAAPAAPAAAAPAAPAASAPADLGLDFKLEEVQLPETPAAPAAAASPAAAPAGDSLEFDLGSLSLDTGAAAPESPAPAAPPAAEPALDLGDFDLSAPAGGAGSGEVVEMSADLPMDAPAGGGDESSTKLDLARAYIDMGDADMAKSLLNEVSQQGNAEQQKEAQELLKRVSG